MKYLLLSIFLMANLQSYAQTPRYPYIQSPTETTVIVAWRTAGPELSTVNYGSDPANLNLSLNDATPKTKHHFTITGLNPDTRYYYQVQSPSLNAAVETFETAKPDMQAPFTFLHYGDCGYNNQVQSDIAALMQSENANFGVVSGDVDQGNGDNYDNIFFGVYKDMLKRECHFTSIGNHDTYADNAATYLDEFYLPSNNDQNTERYYTFTWGNAKFICLDSNLPYTQGTDQYNFLQEELSCNDRQWLFVFFHHPPWTNAWDISYYFPFTEFYMYEGNTDMRSDLVPLFEQYDVDFVLNGHSHCYQRGELNGVKYVISGGAGASILDANTNSNSPNIDTEIYENQYVIFSVNGDTATYKCINRSGTIIDEVNSIKAGFLPYSSSISATGASCSGNNGTASISVNGPNAPYNIQWSTGASGNNIGNLAAGDYQATITGTNSCSTEILSVTVAETIQFTVTPSQVDATCNALQDGSATVAVSSGTATILWSTGNTTPSINNLSAGTYSVTISEAGCQAVEVFEIENTIDLSPNISPANGNPSFCSGSSTGLLADTGFASYNWSNGMTGQSITINQAGTYQVSVTDNQGCTGISNSITIVERPSPTLLLNTTGTSCPGANDGSVQATATGGTTPFSFLWSNGASSQNIDNIPAGNYTLTVTDINGCTAIEMATVNQGSNGLNPMVTSSNGSFSFCAGTSLTLTAEAGFDSYAWSNGATGTSITVLQGGNYTVSVSDIQGCTGENTVAITELAVPVIATNTSGTSCALSSDGSVVASATGGFPPYAYAWENGVNAPSNPNLPAGNFGLTVTGSNNCASNTTVNIPAGNEVLDPQITSSNGLFEFCEGENLVLSTALNYDNYTWSNGMTTPSIIISTPGAFTVAVDNDDGCAGEAQSISVLEKPLPLANFTYTITDNTVTFLENADFESSYAWGFGDGMVSSDANPTHTYTMPGDYTVSLVVENECGSASFQEVITISISGIEDGAEIREPLLVPNPFSEGATLTFGNPQHKAFRLDLIGVDGRILRSFTGIREGEFFIDGKGLAAGVYFYRLSGNGAVFVGKMVVE